MKTKLFTALVAFAMTTSLFAQEKIQVPYFQTLSGMEICGTENCNPTVGAWVPLVGGYLYDGDPKSILGRKMGKKINDNRKCTSREPNDNEFQTLREGTLNGTLDIDKKDEFDVQVTTELTKIINQFIDVSKEVKAELLAEIENSVKSKSNAKIELKYKIIQLHRSYLDTEIETCRKTLKRSETVIAGISVLTVSGNWNSSTLKDIFRTFEANAKAFKMLDADAKLKYEESKNKVLEAKFEPFSLIFNVAYLGKIK